MRFSPYVYISPFFLLFLVVGMFPLVYTAVVSVYDWSLIGGKGEFVGLQNYRDVLDNPYFWKSAVNTLSIFVLSSGPQIVIAARPGRPAGHRACAARRSGGWACCCRSWSRRSPSASSSAACSVTATA